MTAIERTIVAPLRNPAVSIDLRELLVRALERELAERCGGNPVLNRLEAEQRVDLLLQGSENGQSRLDESWPQLRLRALPPASGGRLGDGSHTRRDQA